MGISQGKLEIISAIGKSQENLHFLKLVFSTEYHSRSRTLEFSGLFRIGGPQAIRLKELSRGGTLNKDFHEPTIHSGVETKLILEAETRYPYRYGYFGSELGSADGMGAEAAGF